MSKTVIQENRYPNNGGDDAAAGGASLENRQTVTNGAPFSADELALAMSQSTIKANP